MDQLYFCTHTYIIPLEYIGECSCHRYVSYMSVAERNKCIFLYRYCCKGRYSVCVPLKCLGKSGKSWGIWSQLESGHPKNMKSGSNNFKYFPEKQLTTFSVP